MKLGEIKARLTALQSEAAQIRQAERILFGHWIDSTKSRGKIYQRLRCWDNGKAKYVRSLKPDEVDEIKIAIARGNRLDAIRIERQHLEAQLDKLIAIAEELGLPVPD
jgi:hypothetical protein